MYLTAKNARFPLETQAFLTGRPPLTLTFARSSPGKYINYKVRGNVHNWVWNWVEFCCYHKTMKQKGLFTSEMNFSISV